VVVSAVPATELAASDVERQMSFLYALTCCMIPHVVDNLKPLSRTDRVAAMCWRAINYIASIVVIKTSGAFLRRGYHGPTGPHAQQNGALERVVPTRRHHECRGCP
jgi:hypothetical protein